MIAVVMFLILLLAAVCFAAKTKQPPMDRDVIRRIRSFGEQARREEIFPFE